MDAKTLQDAVAAFLASGGQIQEVAQVAAFTREKPDHSELAEKIRAYRYITDAAKGLNVSTRTVGLVAREYGIRFDSKNSLISRDDREQMVIDLLPEIRRAAKTEGRRAISERLGIPFGTLRRIAQDAGVQFSAKRGPKPKQEATA